MDPLSALGLASNAIQLVDFAGRLVLHGLELRRSVTGGLSANNELESLAKDLNGLCAGLRSPTASADDTNSSDSEKALFKLSCEELGAEFSSVLDDLKVKGRHKTWQSVRQALRAAWKEKDLLNYKDRLNDYRSQIALHLLSLLSVEQSKAARSLDRLTEMHESHMLKSVNEPERLRREIIALLKDVQGSTARADSMSDVTAKLSALSIESNDLRKELDIIEGLDFEMIFERQSRIKEATPRTFEWLFTRKTPGSYGRREVSMLDWLETGSGSYWVSGKAGAGKSTLMKYLKDHKKTREALGKWAGDKRLAISSHFFWNAGTDMQKSQLGLLQTLLYEVLRWCPSLISCVCPSRWKHTSQAHQRHMWTRAELLDAFGRLGRLKLSNDKATRFCFFIDGLDEFGGDYEELIVDLGSLASSPDVKICFSSRPWNVFENAYGENSGRKLLVQDHTREDIRRYILHRFEGNPHFQPLKASDRRYELLVTDIVDRANGVFLWVFLVVHSLCRGMGNSDTIAELRQRLHTIPNDLEEYFQHMLNSIEKVYHQGAARILLICLAAQGPLPKMTVSYFDETDLNFALSESAVSEGIAEMRQRLENTKKRLLARCVDLVEISSVDRVDFMHRTVHDFLETPEPRRLLALRAGPNFDAHRYLCNAMLRQMTPKAFTPHLNDCFHRRSLSTLIDEFLNHAYELEFGSKITNLQLLDALDTRIAALRVADNLRTSSKWRNLSKTLGSGYHHFWLIKKGVERGLYSYFCREVYNLGFAPGLRIQFQRPMLDFALRPGKDIPSQRKYFVRPDARLISFLLEEGADPNIAWSPNEEHAREPIWWWFLQDAKEYEPNLMVEIAEMLLMHGAEFAVKDTDGSIRQYFRNISTREQFSRLDNAWQRTVLKKEKKPRGHSIVHGDGSQDCPFEL